jgi:homoserine kinase
VPTSTARSGIALPLTVAHGDAAASVAAATILGAAIASGDATLLAAAFHDRLHEPYRSSPLLGLSPPAGALGVTLSGSGPSVVVWTHPERTAAVAAELRASHPDTTVLPLRVAEEGARLVDL